MSRREYNITTVGDQVEDFLDRVLDAADLDVDFDLYDGDETQAYFEGPTLVVKFDGPEVSYLMANKGEALLALEQLTQEALRMSSDEHALMCFDANDFRLLRQEELRLSALTVAERVRETNTPYRFNPMNSRERRVVHLALRGETDLRTESSGVGPGRHVVVYPAGMPSLPELPPQPAHHRDGPGHGPPRGRPSGPRSGGPPRRGRR
ncbi:MAG: protein jag [Bryobacteraceae bacterium]